MPPYIRSKTYQIATEFNKPINPTKTRHYKCEWGFDLYVFSPFSQVFFIDPAECWLFVLSRREKVYSLYIGYNKKRKQKIQKQGLNPARVYPIPRKEPLKGGSTKE
jgi:hypothetical protein